VDLGVGAHRSGGCERGARRSVLLGLVVQFDDLGSGHEAGGFCREAHHQDGADGEIGRDKERPSLLLRQRIELLELRGAEPGRADNAGDSLPERLDDVLLDRVGLAEVDHRLHPTRVEDVAEVDTNNVVSGQLEPGTELAPDLAAGSEECHSHAADLLVRPGLIASTAV